MGAMKGMLTAKGLAALPAGEWASDPAPPEVRPSPSTRPSEADTAMNGAGHGNRTHVGSLEGCSLNHSARPAVDNLVTP